MIEVKNLVKDYGKVLGADHISLSAPPRSINCFARGKRSWKINNDQKHHRIIKV